MTSLCAFCPAVACEGLTVISACEAHWDNPEGEAQKLREDLQGAIHSAQMAEALQAEATRVSMRLRDRLGETEARIIVLEQQLRHYRHPT